MKKNGKTSVDDAMPEIDLKRARIAGVGEYFRRMAAEQRYVQLDTDLAELFPDAKTVNRVLREYLRLRAVLNEMVGTEKGRKKTA
jgi:hypothetical protein